MFEQDGTPTILSLCAAEWHAIAYGVCDALEGKEISPASLAASLEGCSDNEKKAVGSRYHYYRSGGCIVAYCRSHWFDIGLAGTAVYAAVVELPKYLRT